MVEPAERKPGTDAVGSEPTVRVGHIYWLEPETRVGHVYPIEEAEHGRTREAVPDATDQPERKRD